MRSLKLSNTEFTFFQKLPTPYFMSKSDVQRAQKALKIDREQVGWKFLGFLKTLGLADVSRYQASAVLEDDLGRLIGGSNMEWKGLVLNTTIHSEQFMISHALLRGVKSIKQFWFSAAPCGHCRQFLAEVDGTEKVRTLLMPVLGALRFETLFPYPFSSKDFGFQTSLLKRKKWQFVPLKTDDRLLQAAIDSASESYVPYTRCPSGIVLQDENAKIFRGFTIENAAWNPSIAPLQIALIDQRLQTTSVSNLRIRRAILVETLDSPYSSLSETQNLLRSINENSLRLEYYQIRLQKRS